MKQFKGRVITPGEVTAEAVVTTEGFNTLASFQMALQFGDKEVKCGDQNNTELHGKPLIGKALCLPQTIGSTTGGLVLYCTCSISKIEGEYIIERIMKECSHIELVVPDLKEINIVDGKKLPEDIIDNGVLRTLPYHIKNFGGMDSFFAVCIKKK